MPCDLRFERDLWKNGVSLVAGIDEAGRGPLAGPVVAAAVILPAEFPLTGLKDSKQLPERVREQLFETLTDDGTLVCYGVGIAEPGRDRSIQYSTSHLFGNAKGSRGINDPTGASLDRRPSSPLFRRAQTAIIGGDAKSMSIAAASIIAKVTRDRMMRDWHKEFPQYDFDRNKGYGTPSHLESLQIHGPCPIHRRSFEPVSQTYFPFH